MKRTSFIVLLAAPLRAARRCPPHAALRVFACEPEWGALAQELGGDLVDVSVATTALQDPHQIQAKPSLIARARNADLVVCTGAELEIGWLPVLLQQSGNAKVQPGQPGNFAAADYVRKLEVPTQLDRSQGDVHAAGNPHIQTDPRNIAQVASGARRAAAAGRPGERGAVRAAPGRLRAALAAGDGALDGAGRAAEGRRRSCRSTRPSSTSTTGSA